MIGVDTSFLVGLSVVEHPSHRRCWDLFEREILGGSGTMGIAPQVLTEFCHVITDGRRFTRPLEMTDAIALCEQWWNSRECHPVNADNEAGVLFLTWMHDLRLGRKRLLDTMLAATYHRAGIRRLATTDWRDFATYGVFDIEAL